MGIYLLKDVIYDTETSKIDNFSRQWLKWYPCANTIFYNMPITEEDIIIVNLYKDDPYGKYKIPDKCKKLFIVHSVSDKVISYIESDADFVIYMSKLSRKIVEDIAGIKKPCLTAPRHPMPVFKTKVNQKPILFVGGWFTPEKTEGLLEKLLNLHGKLPKEYQFGIYPVWGKVKENLEAINKISTAVKERSYEFGERVIFISSEELSCDIMNLNIRICSHAFLWDSGPSVDKVLDMFHDKDPNILNYDIEQSALLGICEASKIGLDVENRIKFLPHFHNAGVYTYQQFSQLVRDALNKIK